MRIRSCIAKLILTAFLLAALFGIYGMVSFTHAEHGNCPASPAEHALCGSPLEHLGHWQAVFTAVFAEVLALFAIAAVFLYTTALVLESIWQTKWHYRSRAPLRPTLLQELFSQGILHRKEPQLV